MPSGKKRKRHKVATHKRKKEEEPIVIRKNSVVNTLSFMFFEIIIN